MVADWCKYCTHTQKKDLPSILRTKHSTIYVLEMVAAAAVTPDIWQACLSNAGTQQWHCSLVMVGWLVWWICFSGLSFGRIGCKYNMSSDVRRAGTDNGYVTKTYAHHSSAKITQSEREPCNRRRRHFNPHTQYTGKPGPGLFTPRKTARLHLRISLGKH